VLVMEERARKQLRPKRIERPLWQERSLFNIRIAFQMLWNAAPGESRSGFIPVENLIFSPRHHLAGK
jgi:hypothetical protein